MRAWGQLTDQIIDTLKTGPMTVVEICEIINDIHGNTRAVMTRLRRSGRVHILKWIRGCVEGLKPYTRPVYKLGPGVDAKKPKPVKYSGKKADPRHKVSSIFDLGLKRDEKTAKLRVMM